MRRRRPRSALLPYTTLFRSPPAALERLGVGLLRILDEPAQQPEPFVGERVELRQVGPAIGLDRSEQRGAVADRKSTRLNSSHANISYAVFCLKKKHKPRIAL